MKLLYLLIMSELFVFDRIDINNIKIKLKIKSNNNLS